MKDKKMIFGIIVLVLILLGCLFGIRSCQKNEEKPNEPEILIPSDDENEDQDNNNNEDNTIDEVVTSTTTNNQTSSVPTITLNGSDLIYVEINTAYVDEGAMASDQKYGDLTDKIIVNNPVDLSKLGTYKIDYTITNEDGKSATISRTVIVQDTTAPSLKVEEEYVEEVVLVNADKEKEFTEHKVITEDNSKGEVSLEIVYYYKEKSDDEYQEVESLDLSKVGYYELHYIAVDESENKTEEALVVEYLVQDVLGPEITVSMNGNSYPVLDLEVKVNAQDSFSELDELSYAWVLNLTDEPVYEVMENNTILKPENGSYYLLLKATDTLGNESKFTSELFQKDDTLMEVTNFNLHSDQNYGGVNAGIKINKLEDITEIESVVVKLYSDTTLLATNTSLDKIYELTLVDNSIQLSTPFIVKEGTYQEEYWDSIQEEYSVDLRPNKVVFEVTKTNGEVHTLENTNLVEPSVYWEGFFYDYDILVGENYGHYQTVQDAILNASSEDTILVLSGTYDGSVIIDKNVTIYGLDKENTILTNTIDNNAIIQINDVVVVSLSNLTLSGNNTVSGTKIEDATVTMDNMILTKVLNAVDVSGNSEVTISNTHINNVVGEENKGYIDVLEQSMVNISDTTIIAQEEAKEDGNIGVYYHGDETSGTIEDSVLVNMDTAIAYDDIEPTTNNNTYVNCNSEVETTK